MNITYYVDDGYVGSGSRPHHINVDDSMLEDCETLEEKIELVEEAIKNHFHDNILWVWDSNDYESLKTI